MEAAVGKGKGCEARRGGAGNGGDPGTPVVERRCGKSRLEIDFS